ncbi:MAG TPA: hypothetical protein VEK08_25105 [Planctomycetota bacterium]|nr:hypothetical protein [Planctomycetota bacterium]
MPDALTAHLEYLEKHGFWRWVLRECVRANPFYVVSAALLAYGVLQLNSEIDPQIGKVGGIVLSLVLLHVYELAILAAASIVLKNRAGGGRDLHGLTIVAALFLGGSLLALDELIALWWWLGYVLIPAALLLAALKLWMYARLPGVFLPRSYRAVILVILAAHSISALLGAPHVRLAIGITAEQRLGWLCGWVSLLSLLWLIHHERNTHAPAGANDPLQTPWCGTWAVLITTGTSIAHLYGTDWVFDRAPDARLHWPMLLVFSAAVFLLRWQRDPRFDGWNAALAAVPVSLLHWAWIQHAPFAPAAVLEMFLSSAVQLWLASALVYVSLAWSTRVRSFYAGLLGCVSAPAAGTFWHLRGSIPHFRALVSASAGFVLLILGVITSLFRERLLRWLDPQEARPAESVESLP